MNVPPDPMTAKLTDNPVTSTNDAALDGPSDVRNPSAGLRSRDSFIQGLNRGIQQLLELW
jgi:hypothetical protein